MPGIVAGDVVRYVEHRADLPFEVPGFVARISHEIGASEDGELVSDGLHLWIYDEMNGSIAVPVDALPALAALVAACPSA